MHGEHVRKGVAAPRTRAHGLVNGQIEAHAEGGGREPLIEQRPGGDAERQVHVEAEEILTRSGLDGCGRLCGRRTAILLQHFGERTERPLQIIVFIRAIDVIERRESLAHISPRMLFRMRGKT